MANSQQVPQKLKQGLPQVAATLPMLPWPLALFDSEGSLTAVTPQFESELAAAGWPHDRELAAMVSSLPSLQAGLSRLTDGDEQSLSVQLEAPAEKGGRPLAVSLHHLPLADQPATLLRVKTSPAGLGAEVISLEGFPIGVLLVPDGLRVEVVNRSLANLLDLDVDDYQGREYQHLFDDLAEMALEPEVVAGSLRQAVAALAERPVVEIALAGDRRRYLEVVLFPLSPGSERPAGWGGLVEDVTDTRDQLSWKLELLSILAHDIRTPLATLKGHATALLANYRRWSDSMVLEFLEAMDRGTDELVRQVDRSLALTRVEAGRLGLRPESVAPQDLLNGALERAAGALGEHKIERQLPQQLPPVRVDPARVEEVLVNLLENAARFSSGSAPIRLTASASETMVTLAVEDEGPGVPQDQQERIFEKYGQVDPDGEGTGLGLFISRKIVEAHGGRLWVESPTSGETTGARFSFTLPVMPPQPAPAKAAPSERRSGPEGEDLKVLIVDDEPDQQALLRALLEESGYQLSLAPDGPSALDQVAADPPDLIVLDLVLPRMDGLTVCRALRRWTSAPVLVLTSRTAADDLVAAIDAGADDYMTKPFQSQELLARLRALRRRAERRPDEPEPVTLGGGGLVIDEQRLEVRRHGEIVGLTPTEYELLVQLARHRRQVLTHEQLIDHLWPAGEGNRHRLFVHVNRLRKKIEEEPDNPRYVVTRWGTGYSFLPGR